MAVDSINLTWLLIPPIWHGCWFHQSELEWGLECLCGIKKLTALTHSTPWNKSLMPQTLLLVFCETQSNQHTSPSFCKLYHWCFGKHSQINSQVPHSANSTVGVLGNTVKSTHKGVNQYLNYKTQGQQRPRLPTVTLTWHAWTYTGHKLGPGEVTHTQKYLVGKELIRRSK